MDLEIYVPLKQPLLPMNLLKIQNLVACVIIGSVGQMTWYAIGWIELIAIVVAGLVVPPNDIGVAEGFFASIRAISGTVATSIYAWIYSGRLNAFLPQDIIPAVQKAGLPSSSIPQLMNAVRKGATTAIDTVPGMNDAVRAALDAATKDAYAHAFKVVYLSSRGFGGLGIIAAFFVTDVDKYMTDFVLGQDQRGGICVATCY